MYALMEVLDPDSTAPDPDMVCVATLGPSLRSPVTCALRRTLAAQPPTATHRGMLSIHYGGRRRQTEAVSLKYASVDLRHAMAPVAGKGAAQKPSSACATNPLRACPSLWHSVSSSAALVQAT